MLNVEVEAAMDREPRTLLKTTTSATGSVGLGATQGAARTDNLGMRRTHVENRERRTRGHELF
ncbi:MAG TPA: hypothetical protein VGI66_02995 [Streptosporangiaceae bacterium]|jgi:hypothetical protein